MSETNLSRARDFADPRIPNRDECVLHYLIERWASERADKVHVVWEDGEEWTFAETRRRTIEKAAGLQKLGVRQATTIEPPCAAGNTP